ncbi:MAG: hypothetical protein ACE5HZ_04870 [Fidelibacterota bacterium]
MKLSQLAAILLAWGTLLPGQGTWLMNGRTHPELQWSTLKTDHFNVHYHNGIEEIAAKGAAIAEKIRPDLLKQAGLDSVPTIDIIFTAEDEIMNGYAMWSYQTFIWVDQNDAVIWLEDEKWLYQVIAHELQHIVLIHAVKTWIPQPFDFLISGMPGWFVEGSAEFFTERWRPYRSDLTHKTHVFKKRVEEIRDPHAHGYSKMLYWADRFGDSTIVKVVQHRNKLGLFRFKKAFKEATGVELKQFEEDWRRLMNTYFYGYRSQKETFEEVGKTSSLPAKEALWFAFSPDSLKIALVGRRDGDQYDHSLLLVELDTTKPEPGWMEKLLPFKKDTTEEKKRKPKFDVDELDYGVLGRGISWSPDGARLAYVKYRYGDRGSLIWGIRVVDVETQKGRWLTGRNLRAAHPDWSPDGQRIAFVAHEASTSNLFTVSPDGEDMKQLTSYTSDTQIVTPRWSPDGKRIAFGLSGPDANCDIHVLDLETGQVQQVTTDPGVDYLPVWHPDAKKITFTSHRGSTPNLHTVDLSTGETIQNTDVGEAVWAVQWTPSGQTVTALTLDDVDSIRIVEVDPGRERVTGDSTVRKPFARWRSQGPKTVLARVGTQSLVDAAESTPYRFYKFPKHLTSIALPYLDFTGVMGLTIWTDALGRHVFQLAGGTTWDGKDLDLLLGYINATSGPFWGINYFRDIRFNLRPYDESKSWLFERLDGWQVFVSSPFNFGNSLSSHHLIQANLFIQTRQAEALYDSVDARGKTYPELYVSKGLPTPQSGKEGILSLAYLWLKRRPHKQNLTLPHQGWGILAVGDLASPAVAGYGDFSYRRLTLDSFTNVPLGPLTFFARGKAILLEGSPPAQEYVGLSNDPPIYFPWAQGQNLGGVMGFVENHNPRGWEGIRLGNRLIFGTLELRFPVLPEFPVINVLGLTFGSTTAALVTDIGNAWNAGEDRDPWVITGGYEGKIALNMGEATLAIVAVGRAQTLDDWKSERRPETIYARLALINPF